MTDTRTDNDEERDVATPPEPDEGPAWGGHRRRRRLVRRVGGHVETRFSYGVLTLCTFGFTATALLLVIAVVGALVLLAQGHFLHALLFFLGSIGFAMVAFAIGFGAGFVGVHFAGDWFLEWPSHVIAWALGLAGCVLLAALVFLTPLPLYADPLLTIATVFGAGYTIAYALRVTSLPTQRHAGNRQTRSRRGKR
jgi:hypothetical protein